MTALRSLIAMAERGGISRIPHPISLTTYPQSACSPSSGASSAGSQQRTFSISTSSGNHINRLNCQHTASSTAAFLPLFLPISLPPSRPL